MIINMKNILKESIPDIKSKINERTKNKLEKN